MKMTPQQENCVKHRGTTLLVSAGAGSGKTSTLAQRIINRISDPSDKAEIDDFLIVTFTNASAKDLSEKIERAVSKCVASDITNKKAVRQLAKIKYANISTISSFCLGVVKKHFQHLSLPSKIRICDEAERDLLKKQAILDIIEEKYATSDDGATFFDAVEMFSGDRNDDKFVDLIFKLHTKIYSSPNPSKWCEEAISKYNEIIACNDYFCDTTYGKMAKSEIVSALDEYIETLKSACDKMAEIDDMKGYYNKFSIDIENAVAYRDFLENSGYNAALSKISDVTKSSLVGVKANYSPDYKKAISEMRNKAYANFQKACRLFLNCSQDELKNAACDCADILNEIFDIISKVDARFTAEKTYSF